MSIRLMVGSLPVVCLLLAAGVRGLGGPLIHHHEHLLRIVQLLEGCGLETENTLRRFHLKGNATCNDGSPAGYYLRKSEGSQRWIVFLEGGWYCYDAESCRSRWSRMRHLMSSKQWPLVRNVGGLLSPNPEENPYWWNANHVFLPYCTSDAWIGGRSEPEPESGFTFSGSLIIRQVIAELLPLGLSNASSLILAGSSAGGAGVMLNLESVQEQLKTHPGILLRGISDSGWFLDRVPFRSQQQSRPPQQEQEASPSSARNTGSSLTAVESIQRATQLWQGQISKSCRQLYPEQAWSCFFGYRLYTTLKVPLFVFQWLFDEAQMTVDNVGAPVTKQQWDYIHKMGDSLRHSLNNLSSVFAPSCISHSVLTKKDWQQVRVDEVSLPQALRCWELSTSQDNFLLGMVSDEPRVGKSPRRNPLLPTNKKRRNRNKLLRGQKRKGGERREGGGRRGGGGKGQQQTKKKMKKNREKIGEGSGGEDGRIERGNSRRRGGGGPKSSRRRKTRKTRGQGEDEDDEEVDDEEAGLEDEICQKRLIERCSWPQCNHSCPKLHNPFTGEEMDFLELLKSFGLEMKSVAAALGMDLQTLNSMDHDELLNLLTQQ